MRLGCEIDHRIELLADKRTHELPVRNVAPDEAMPFPVRLCVMEVLEISRIGKQIKVCDLDVRVGFEHVQNEV